MKKLFLSYFVAVATGLLCSLGCSHTGGSRNVATSSISSADWYNEVLYPSFKIENLKDIPMALQSEGGGFTCAGLNDSEYLQINFSPLNEERNEGSKLKWLSKGPLRLRGVALHKNPVGPGEWPALIFADSKGANVYANVYRHSSASGQKVRLQLHPVDPILFGNYGSYMRAQQFSEENYFSPKMFKECLRILKNQFQVETLPGRVSDEDTDSVEGSRRSTTN